MYLRFFRISVVALLFSFNAYAQQWLSSPVYHGRNMHSLAILDRVNIVVGGGNEQNDSLQDIFTSTAGGLSWAYSSAQGGGYIRAMDFADDQNGLAVGYAGKILKTTNAATSWQQIYGPSPIAQRNFTTVKYLTPQTIVALGGRNYTNDTIQTVIKSTDGGSTWNVIYDEAGRWFKGAYFFDATTGFAVGSKGTISKTIDGGNNWTPVNSPITNRDFNAIHFSNSTTGYIVGGSYVEFDTLTSFRTILKTTDGGNTWNILTDEAGGWLTAIDFLDENTGYIVGDAASYYKTINGGNAWIRNTVPGVNWYSHFTAVKFFNENFGVVAGLYGEVYLYSNEPFPEVYTLPAIISQVTDTSAAVTLRATINSFGSPVTCNFKYSTVPDFSSNVNFAYWPAFPPSFNSNSPTEIPFNLYTLLPNTTYYYFATATSINGTVNGDTLSFTTTIPYVNIFTNNPPSNNFFTVFSGSISGATEPLDLFFEYGTTPLMGNEVQATPTIINDTLHYQVYDTIYTLQPGEIYYYRLKAVSSTDVYYASTVSFYCGQLYSSFLTQSATDVTSVSATLNGFALGFQLPLTNLEFEWGLNSSQMSNMVAANPSSINDTLAHQLTATLAGLQPETFYYFRLKGVTQGGSLFAFPQSFYTGNLFDSFEAFPPTEITETGARLNGYADGFVSSAAISFEYGTAQPFSSWAQSSPNAINDSGEYFFTGYTMQLTPATQYNYRLVANIQGDLYYSNTQSFITALPSQNFSALTATEVTINSARLNGRIYNMSYPCILSFEYGIDPTLGNEIAANPQFINDTLEHFLFANISELDENSFYYYRLKAVSGSNVFYSNTRKVYTGHLVPNWDFSNWTNDTTLVPLQWNVANENFSRVPGSSGGYAIELNGRNFMLMGAMNDGDNEPEFFGGEPFNFRPDSVIITANYSIAQGDTALLLLAMYNGSGYVSMGFYPITGSSGGFTNRSFAINYSSPETPDSIVIGFISFNPFLQSFGGENNLLVIDNVSFWPPAQAPENSNFEQWFSYPLQSPDEWYYAKYLMISPSGEDEGKIVTQAIYTEPDDYALELKNITRAGRWMAGNISVGFDEMFHRGNGFAVAGRHDVFNAYYKFLPENNDTLSIFIRLLKNGNDVGWGYLKQGGIVEEFNPLEILLHYNDSTVPDSAYLQISTCNDGGAMGGSKLIIDKLSFDGLWGVTSDTTGIETYSPDQNAVRVYPNPVKGILIIEYDSPIESAVFIELMDIKGIIIKRLSSNSEENRFEVDLSDISSGIYFLKTISKNKVFVNKIVVVK